MPRAAPWAALGAFRPPRFGAPLASAARSLRPAFKRPVGRTAKIRNVPRIEPAAPLPDGNAVTNGLLARVMRRRPDILEAFGRLDATIRFHGQLPGTLKEAVRRATATRVGCDYCASLAQLRALDWVPRAVRQRGRDSNARSTSSKRSSGARRPTTRSPSRWGSPARARRAAAEGARQLGPFARGASAQRTGQRHPVPGYAQRRPGRAGGVDRAGRGERGAVRGRRAARASRENGHQALLFQGQTLKEIKATLGVSESRVSQIHAQAVIHLRQKLKVLREDLGYRENDPTVRQKYVRKPPASGVEVVG